MARAALIGPLLCGGLSGAALAWPGGDGPAGLLGPQQLVVVVPAFWALWCAVAVGRAGALLGTALALPPTLAAVVLAAQGWGAALAPVAVVCAAGAWWGAATRFASVRGQAWRPHLLGVALTLALLPPLCAAIWHALGQSAGPLPGAMSPMCGATVGLWSAVPLSLLAAACWLGAREAREASA